MSNAISKSLVNAIQMIQIYVGLVPDAQERYAKEITTELERAWSRKKNRAHVKELICKLNSIRPDLNIIHRFKYCVLDFGWDWSSYDYRNV